MQADSNLADTGENLEKNPIQIEPGWKATLASEFSELYMRNLRQFLVEELKKNKLIYPKPSEYFSAFNWTPFDKVKVVILGQDPYHGPGQAHGLCFSVRPGVPSPPSLINIFKELQRDLKIPQARHGCLVTWAQQGVLLLNSSLSVRSGEAGSHQNKGWEEFTDKCIQKLAQERRGLVFMFWGSSAQKKGAQIDVSQHLVLKAPHPSPLSAYRGFLGCGHFSKANNYLKSRGLSEINWALPDIQSVQEILARV